MSPSCPQRRESIDYPLTQCCRNKGRSLHQTCLCGGLEFEFLTGHYCLTNEHPVANAIGHFGHYRPSSSRCRLNADGPVVFQILRDVIGLVFVQAVAQGMPHFVFNGRF
jgi:hypothetical protein